MATGRKGESAHGVSVRALTLRAKKEGWVPLVGTKRLKPGPKPRAAREAKMQRAAVEELRRRDIIRRLLARQEGGPFGHLQADLDISLRAGITRSLSDHIKL